MGYLAAGERGSEARGLAPGGVRLRRGSRLDQFRIEGVLGSGGFGTVYRATDTVLGRSVAVKVLSPSLAYTEEGRARFLREARLAARVSHPNVVKVFSVGEVQDHPYIAYDYIDGPTLADLASEEYPLEPQRVSRLIGQLAQGIQALHDVNVVHRDVKPVNALVWGRATDSETVLLTDLGIATDPDPRATQLTRTGYIAPGTLPYMAPEALYGPVGPAGDQYSLGVSAFELLAGMNPFNDGDATTSTIIELKLADVPPSPSDYVDGLPPPLDTVVRRALARRPEDRFETVVAFARALDQALGGVEAKTASRAAPGQLAPYASWEPSGALPEPLFARIDEIGDGLAEIIAVEGPVVCERAFRLYLRGAGRSQLTAELRQRMSRALSAQTRSGEVLAENEWRSRGLLDRVLRVPSQPEVLLRELGPRRLDEVPPREWAAAAQTILDQRGGYADRDELVRAVAGLYGRQRVAARLHSLIEWSLKQYLE
jgi:serine/threonine protein kinase